MRDFNDTMLEVFLFETEQQIELLETSMIISEQEQSFSESEINEIFRVMHTIKSSAAMMLFDNMSNLAHTVEDLFYCLREEKPTSIDFSGLSDLVFESIDFMKVELAKIRNGDKADGDVSQLLVRTKEFLKTLTKTASGKEKLETKEQESKTQQYYVAPAKSISIPLHYYKAVLFFQEGCQMEEVRAFGVVHKLKDLTRDLYYIPADIVESDESAIIIQQEGFEIYFSTELNYDQVQEFFMQTAFLKELELTEIMDSIEIQQFFGQMKTPKEKFEKIQRVDTKEPIEEEVIRTVSAGASQQSFISVGVAKLDQLMDLVGEMVIAEAMVAQNPDLEGLDLNNFQKAAAQLNKITNEIQDVVMSVRMVPLSTTFHKMQRIVRDMRKKLNKDINLEIAGENTEVDKNIIEHISDPLMHLVRNAADHGIESQEQRIARGKPASGTITLEAKNSGSDVLIIVKDDGKGLDRDQVLQKAFERGLISQNQSDMTDKEVYNLILLPGFSTAKSVSQFSGRGVGMNVVTENIEAIGGSVSVSSVLNEGTTITLKIPLTLAIIDGMNLKVGNSRYTMPTISIRESFRPEPAQVITDPDGNEMIVVRGKAHPIIKLYELYGVQTQITKYEEGILIMIEQDEKSICVFADELLGQQQVVVKSLPEYIRRGRRITGLAGCTLLGDGNISLILEPAGLIQL